LLPREFLERMQKQLGEAFPSFLESLERPRAVALRFNPLKGAAPQLPLWSPLFPGNLWVIIMTRRHVPVCTHITKPAYTIYRRPAQWLP